MAKRSSVIVKGSKKLLKKSLSNKAASSIKKRLTVTSLAYQDNPPTRVECYDDRHGYLEVPRHFESQHINMLDVSDKTSLGKKADLRFELSLLPERGQPEAAAAVINHLKYKKGGILKAQTGFGKTICSYYIGYKFGRRIGVFVYNSHMMKNWSETAYKTFGLTENDVGIVQGDRCEIGRPVTVMMVQSLLSRDYPKELYKQFGILIADEVNRYAAPLWQTVVSKFSARYRLGVSATPNRKDGLDDIIYWNFGPIAYEVKEKESIKRPSVIQMFYNPSSGVNRPTYPFNSYCRWKKSATNGKFYPTSDVNVQRYRKKLMNDNRRNSILLNEMVNARRKGRKSLVMTHFRDHAIGLEDQFNKRLYNAGNLPNTTTSVLIGGVKNLEKAMSADFIFTTYSFSRDALNLPHIDTLFFCTPPGDPTQPLGRLRDMGPEKKSLLAIDMYENTKYALNRAIKRQKVYKKLGVKVRTLMRC